MTGIGIWRLGFRPFYLGAAFFSASAILLWISAIFGLNGLSDSAIMPPLYWHGHEMVFGFAFAVIAGFLLTASNNWTGMLPAAGVSLAVLFLFWGSARLFMFSGHVLLAAIADGAFAVLLTALLGRVLWLARLWKNFTLLSLVILIGAFNISFYSTLLLGLPVNALLPIELALLVILQLLVVMGGRVIPMFTQNGVPGIKIWKPALFAKLTPLLTALGIIGWIALPPHLAFLACLTAAVVNLVRWLGWKPWLTLKHPMVWVLQLGYFWIPVTFLSMGLESLGLITPSLPIHALAVGAMGLIIAGMITRTAMGHTGRPIIASLVESVFFLLILVSGLLRFLAGFPVIQANAGAAHLYLLSGSCWALGFLIYGIRYTPWLCRPRLDGRPG